MFRILIWGCGLQYSQCINAIKYQEVLGKIKVVGITGRDKLYIHLDGYLFISINDVDRANIDYIVVPSEEYYKDICGTAAELGFDKDRIIQGKVFCLPYFDFEGYVNLLRSKVSIIANNCWGGIAYHVLGMQFLSPFINMFVHDEDYLRLLNNLKYYLGLKPQFARMRYTPVLERNYPVCLLDDVELHFNHYTSMEDVEKKWNERIERLNWDNLFIMMYTDKHSLLERLDSLPYDKKICFIPFVSSLKSAYYLQVSSCQEMRDVPLWEIVNRTVSGYLHDYDLIKMLASGKVNHDRYYVK